MENETNVEIEWPAKAANTEAATIEVSDFNHMDQAVIALLVEQYRSLRAAYASSADTSNRMIQFLAVASAGLGTVAVNYLLRGDKVGMGISSLLFLAGLPGTIAVIYLAWVREFLQKARSSLLLLRLEGRISKFIFQLQTIFQQTSRTGRRQVYATMQEVFGNRFADSEIWMRRENPQRRTLIEKRAYIAISLVFFSVAIMSLDVGFLIGNSVLQSQCEGSGSRPLQHLAINAEQVGLERLVFPLETYRATQTVCAKNAGQTLAKGLCYVYLTVLLFGLSVGIYTINLLIVVGRITRQITEELYK